MKKELIIILGPPSADGEILGKNLSTKLGIPFIHFGKAIRMETLSKSDLGNRMKSKLDNGEALTNDLLTDLVLSKIPHGNFTGLIVNGYPRDISQIENLKSAYKGAISSVIGININFQTPSKMSQKLREALKKHDIRNDEIIDFLNKEGQLIKVGSNYEIAEIVTKVVAAK